MDSGVSLGATRRDPLAGWKGLLLTGAARAVEVANLSDGWGTRRRGDIESDDLDEMIGAATRVTTKLGERTGSEYRRWQEDTARL